MPHRNTLINTVHNNRDNSQKIDFPMNKAKGTGCGETVFTGGTAFYYERILVYDKTRDRYGFFDFSGNLIIPAVFKLASTFDSKGKAKVVTEDNIYGTIDSDGMFIPEPIACKSKLKDGFYLVSHSGKIFNYNPDPRLDNTCYSSDDFTLTSRNDYKNCEGSKVGVVNSNEEEIIPVVYDTIELSDQYDYLAATVNGVKDYYKYSSSRADRITDSYKASKVVFGQNIVLMKAANSNSWSVFNVSTGENGDYVYDAMNYKVDTKDFGDFIASDYIAARRESQYAILDKNGNEITSPKFQSVKFLDRDLILTEKNGKFGVFYNGTELYEPRYDQIGDFSDGKAFAKMNGRDVYLFLDKEDEKEYYEEMRKKMPPRGQMGGNSYQIPDNF